MKKIFLLLFIYIFSPFIINAQHVPSSERGDGVYRRETKLEANDVRTSIHNFAFAGRTSGEYPFDVQTPYEWPKGSGKVYCAIRAMLIGAEVVDINGATIQIVDVPTYRTAPSGYSWSLEPVPGYLNLSGDLIAKSTIPSSWPEFWPDRMNDPTDPGWPGSWDGYFGKNVFIEGEELYYHCTDDNYDRHDYFPDSTDLTRRGLGLIIGVRSFAFDEPLLSDVIFQSYSIKNDGTKKLEKLSASLWNCDFVGGNGDSQDDLSRYSIEHNLVWSHDRDHIAPDFGSDPVGAYGNAFLITPENIDGSGQLSISNAQYEPAGSWSFSTVSDEIIWSRLLEPGSFYDPNSVEPGEYDSFVSFGYFSLEPGESTEILFSTIFVNGPFDDPDAEYRYSELLRKREYIKKIADAGFNFDSFETEITSPSGGDILSGTIEITWSTEASTGQASTYLFYSPDNGVTWQPAGKDTLNSGSFLWDTSILEDGVLYKLRIMTISDDGLNITESEEVFTINNPGNGKPGIYITDPHPGEMVEDMYNVKWIGGDPDGDNCKINLYRVNISDDQWILFAENIQNTGVYNFDTGELPNSTSQILKGEIIAGQDTTSFETGTFEIFNERIIYPDTTLQVNREMRGTGEIEIHIAEENNLIDHDYFLTFENVYNEDSLIYSVYDVTDGNPLLQSILVKDSTTEGPPFDGLRMLVKNHTTELIENGTGWNITAGFDTSTIRELVFEPVAYQAPVLEFKRSKPSDYLIEFDAVGVDTSVSGVIQGHTFPAAPVNFSVKNITENKFIDFIFVELDTIGGNPGMLTNAGAIKDRIIFIEEGPDGAVEETYWAYLNSDDGRFPDVGDDFTVRTRKTFSKGDTLWFSMSNVTYIEKDLSGAPEEYFLEQNYPNPFNPETTIRFGITHNSKVKLAVFDILGRKVTTLVNEELSAGNYNVIFDAKKFASGVYIYKLETPGFSSSRKMILLK